MKKLLLIITLLPACVFAQSNPKSSIDDATRQRAEKFIDYYYGGPAGGTRAGTGLDPRLKAPVVFGKVK